MTGTSDLPHDMEAPTSAVADGLHAVSRKER